MSSDLERRINSMDYKKTLNLPRTSLPMKGNLPQTEPKRIQKWKEEKIYEKMLEKNKKKKEFLFVDGPPYANGSLHLGHVLNKVLKDIIVKYKNLSGYYTPFIPGWDCHGLPIELKVMKKLRGSRTLLFQSEMDKKKFSQEEREEEEKKQRKTEEEKRKVRAFCKKEALKWVEKQREEFRRLGVIADWKNPYLTLDSSYIAEEIRLLAKLYEKGFLRKGEKPVYWCPKLQTALAAAEVEYFSHKSLSTYLKFDLFQPLKWKNFKTQKSPFSLSSSFRSSFGNFLQKLLGEEKKSFSLSFLIWTTTPWTLPANQAVAIHPDFEYKIYICNKYKGENFLFAKGLKEQIEKETGVCFQEREDFPDIAGKDLEGLFLQHPLFSSPSPVILSEFVTLDTGTGCVHTAPGHGIEDYKLGLRYNLKIEAPVDERGRYTSQISDYKGENVFEVSPKIVSRLKASSHLFFSSEIEHNYPYNPRTETPLIFRATPQWFIKMKTAQFDLKQEALDFISSKIQFFPAWGKERLKAMVEHAPDWCLSRQRLWGVPFPVFYCKKCKEVLIQVSLMLKIADEIEKSKEGFEVYYSIPLETWLKGQVCSHCGNKNPKDFERSQDILDVWFDSGVCHKALMQNRLEMGFPADLYLEGSDQHRGWFQTSLLSSLAYAHEAPYKNLITHGFILDHKGHKMSKSKGNIIEPLKIFQESGAEILRLLMASEDYGQDLNIGEETLQRVKEVYRKTRNTLRFLLSNLYDFQPQLHLVKPQDMTLLDQWILSELKDLIEKLHEAYESYQFYRIFQMLNHFFTVTLSSFYLDVLKDRLYTSSPDSLKRRASQSVLFHVLHYLTPLISPIFSFLAEEVYALLPLEGKKQSVFLTSFSKVPQDWVLSKEKKELFAFLLFLRSQVQKVLELERKKKEIGSSLEGKVIIQCKKEELERIQPFFDELHELLIVSELEFKENLECKDFSIQAFRSEGEKCPRCWHYSKDTKKNNPYEGLCSRCVAVLEKKS